MRNENEIKKKSTFISYESLHVAFVDICFSRVYVLRVILKGFYVDFLLLCSERNFLAPTFSAINKKCMILAMLFLLLFCFFFLSFIFMFHIKC